MANFGVVLSIVGKINIIDALGNVRELVIGDEILASDTLVGVTAGASKIVFSNGYQVELSIGEGWKDSKYLIIRDEEEISSDFFKNFDSSNAEQILNSLILNEDFFNSLPKSATGRAADLEAELQSGDRREDSANNNRSTLRPNKVAADDDNSIPVAPPVIEPYRGETPPAKDSGLTDSNNKETVESVDPDENSGESSTANPPVTQTPISFRQKFLALMDTNPNQSEIAALGITGVTADNLAGLKYAILSQQGSVIEVTDLQLIVDQATAAFENIAEAAEGNNASSSSLSLSSFQMLGVDSMDASNQQMIYSALNTEVVNADSVASVAAIQIIVDSYNKVIAAADDTANDNATLGILDLQHLGVTGVLNSAQLQLFNSAVDLMATADIDSVDKLQLIADAVLAVIAAAIGTTNMPSVAQLHLLGIDGATEQNLVLVQQEIRKTGDAASVDSVTELQVVVSNAVSELSIALNAVLEDSASPDGQKNADGDAVSYVQLSLIAENVRKEIVGEYQAAIVLETDFSYPPTSGQVQNIINIVNDAYDAPYEAILEDSSYEGGGAGNSDGVKVTWRLLSSVATNVKSELEFFYQREIADFNFDNLLPTPVQVQALIDSVNESANEALAEILEDSPLGNNNGNETPVSSEQLKNVFESVRVELLVKYQKAIANNEDFTSPVTFKQIQTLLEKVNDAADKALEEILEDSSSPGGDSNHNKDAVSLLQLQAVAEGINELLVAQYQKAIAETSSFFTPFTVAQVQLLVDSVNIDFTTALDKITAAAGKSDATNVNLDDYWNAAIPKVDADNLSLINELLGQQLIDSLNDGTSNIKVTQLVKSYLLIQEVATDSSGHAQLLNVDHYQNIGVAVSEDSDVLQLLAQVIESLTAEQVSAQSEIQALANTVTKIMLKAAGGDANLSAAELSALGVTGVTVDNLISILADIAGTGDGSAVANLVDLQALITAVQDQALLKIDDYNLLADGSAPALALVLQDYQNAMIEGVQQADVAMLNAAVLLQENHAVDSVDEIVALLSNAKQAVVDIQTLVGDPNNPNAANIALTSFKALGLAVVSESNLSDINALLKTGQISNTDVHSYAKIASLLESFVSILDSADGNRDSASADLPDAADYTKIGVVFNSQLTSNEVAKLLSDWIDGLNTPQVNTLAEIQQLVAQVETLMFAAKGDSGAASGLEMADLTVFGLNGITANNFASMVKKIVDSANDGSQINSLAAIQGFINAVKTEAIADIEAYNNSTLPIPAEDVLTLQHYWDAGFDQVNAANIDLYNAAVFIQEENAADTAAKIQEVLTSADQSMLDIIATAVKNDANQETTSVANYQQIGLTTVDSDNLAAINALLYSATIGTDQVNSYALIKGLIDSYTKIQDAADGTFNSQGLPSKADFVAIGIVFTQGLDSDQVASLLSDWIGGLGSAEVASQGQVQALLAKVEIIMQAAALEPGDPSPLTVADLTVLGMADVNLDNFPSIRASIIASANDGSALNTLANLQSVIDLVKSTAITKIKNYDADSNNDATPDMQDYLDAGVANTDLADLPLVNAAIARQPANATDTSIEIQAVITQAKLALVKIINAADKNDPSVTNLIEASTYQQVGIDSLTADNVADINALLNTGPIDFDKLAGFTELADLVSSYLLIQSATDDNPTAIVLTQSNFEAIGVDFKGGASAAGTALLSELINTLQSNAVDTLAEIQSLADAVVAVMATAGGSGSVTQAQLQALGMSDVSANNLVTINAQIQATEADGSQVDTLTELQKVITDVRDTAVAIIEAHNNSDVVAAPVPVLQDYWDAGITGVRSANLDAVNARILALAEGEADTKFEIQAVANAENTAYDDALELIFKAAKDNNFDAGAVDLSVYQVIGIQQLTAENFNQINDLLFTGSISGTDVASAEQIQQLVTSYFKIQQLAADTSGEAPLPVSADYDAIGIDVDNDPQVLQLLTQVVDGSSVDQIDSQAEIQQLVDTVKAVMSVAAGGSSDFSAAELIALGLQKITVNNLATIKAQIANTADDGSAVDTLDELQTLITKVETDAVAKIELYNKGNGTAPAPLTVQDYWNAGIDLVTSDNLQLVNVAILSREVDGADSKTKISTVIDNAILSLADIKAAADATNGAVELSDYENIGLTVSAENVTRLNLLLNRVNITAGKLTGFSEVELLVRSYQIIQTAANGTLGDAPLPVLANYMAIGVDVTNNSQVLQLLAQAIDHASSETVETQQQLQDLATAAAEVINTAGLAQLSEAVLSAQMLSALGLIGVNSGNLPSVLNKIIASATDGSAVDSIAELQAYINEVETTAITLIEAYNNDDGAAPEVQDYLDANIGQGVDDAQVTADNLAAVNETISAADPGDADTLDEIQLLVNAAVDAFNAALSAIKVAAQTNSANSDDPQADIDVAHYLDLGIKTVTSANLEAINRLLDGTITDEQADSYIEIEAMVTSYLLIQSVAGGNSQNLTLPVLADFKAIGITDLTTSDTTAAALLGDIIVGLSASDVELQSQLQELADTTVKIMQLAAGDSAVLSAQDYIDLGLSGVNQQNLITIEANIAATTDNGEDIDTFIELQDLITAVKTDAIADIIAYSQGDGSTPAPLELQDYHNASISTADLPADGSFALANAALLANLAVPADAAAITAVLTLADTAFDRVFSAAVGNQAIDTLTATDYENMGWDTLTANQITNLNALLNHSDINGDDMGTYQKLHSLITGYNKILDLTGGGRDTVADLPVVADYQAIDVTVDPASIKLLNQCIDGLAEVDAKTLTQLRDLAEAADAVMDQAAEVADSLTAQQLTLLGFTGVSSANLISIKAKIAATADDGSAIDTFTELQEIIDGVKSAALDKISAYNSENDLVPEEQDYLDADIDQASLTDLALVNAVMLQQPSAATDTTAEIATLIDQAISAIGRINAWAGGASQTVTIDDYTAVGVAGVIDANLQDINNLLKDSPSTVASYPALDDLVKGFVTIQTAADNGVALTAIGREHYQAIGVNLTAANSDADIALLSDLINGLVDADVNTLAELQKLTDAVVAVIDTATGNTALSVAQLAEIGLTQGVSSANLVTIIASFAATNADASQINSIAELQNLIDKVGTDALGRIEAYNAGNDNNATLLTQDYWDAGISGVNSGNIEAINARILALDVGAANSVAEIQDIVNLENTAFDLALNMIVQDAAIIDGDSSSSTNEIGLSTYTDLGLTNLDADNHFHITNLLHTTKILSSHVDSFDKIKALVDSFVLIQNSADGTAGNDVASRADYQRLGVDVANGTHVLNLLNNVIEGLTRDKVDTQGEIQGLADTAEKVLGIASGGTHALSVAELINLGLDSVTDKNISTVKEKIAQSPANGDGVDQIAELQQIIDAVIQSAVDKIDAYNQANNSEVGVPQLQDYRDANIDILKTGSGAGTESEVQIEDYLALANAAVLNKGPADTNSVSKIQDVINTAKQALADIQAAADSYATPITLAYYANIGLAEATKVTDGNLQKINNLLKTATITSEKLAGYAEVKALVEAYVKIQGIADGTAGSELLALRSDYSAIGVDVIADNQAIDLLSDVIDRLHADKVESQQQIQNLANTVAKIFATAQLAEGASSDLSAAELNLLGLLDVSADNLVTVVNKIIAKTMISEVDSYAELKALVKQVSEQAIDYIEDYNNNLESAPELQKYLDAGIARAELIDLALINAAILNRDEGGASSFELIDAVVTAANAAMDTIKSAAAAVPDTVLSLSTYGDIGFRSVTEANVSQINNLLYSENIGAGQVENYSEIEFLVESYLLIQELAAGSSTDPVTSAHLLALAIVVADDTAQLELLNDVIAKTSTAQVQTQQQLKDFADSVDQVIATAALTQSSDSTLSVEMLTALGLNGVNVGNLSSILAKIASTVDDGSGVDSIDELQTLIGQVKSEAVTKIEAYNNDSGIVPDLQDYLDAGIGLGAGNEAVTADNLAAVNRKIVTQETHAADSVAKIQALVNLADIDFDAAVIAITAAAEINNANHPTDGISVSQYHDLGLTDVTSAHLNALNDLLDTADLIGTDVGTYAKIQAFVASYLLIHAAADGVQGNATDLPLLANFKAIDLAIDDHEVGRLLGQVIDGLDIVDVDSQTELTALAGQVSKIMDVAAGLNVTLTNTDLTDLGFSGVTAGNISTIEASIRDTANDGTGIDTFVELQDLIDAVKTTALTKINAYNRGDGETPAPLVLQDYLDVGIELLKLPSVELANAIVLNQDDAADLTVADTEALIVLANTAFTDVSAAAILNKAVATVLLSDYQNMGFTDIDASKLQKLNALLDNGSINADKVGTYVGLHALVTGYIKINAMANGTRDTVKLPDYDDYIAIDVSVSNDTEVISLLNDVIDGLGGNAAKTLSQLKALAAAVDAVMATAAGVADSLSLDQLMLLGLPGVSATNFAALKTAIAATDPSGSGIKLFEQLKTVISDSNQAAVDLIEEYNNGDGSAASALTVQHYENANISTVNADNLQMVNAAILIQDRDGADTKSEIETVVDNAIAALISIKAAANNTDTVTVDTFKQLGIANVDASNALKISNLLNTDELKASHVPTYAKVVALVASYKLIQDTADSVRGNEQELPAKSDYEAIAIKFELIASVELGEAAITLLTGVIDGLALANVATHLQIQTLAINAQKIMLAAAGDSSVLDLALFTNLGINGVNVNNLITVKAKIETSVDTGSAVDSFSGLQGLIDKIAIDAIALIKEYTLDTNLNPTPLELQTYLDAGIDNVDDANLDLANAAILIQPNQGADTQLKIQTVIDTANTALGTVKDATGSQAVNVTFLTFEQMGITISTIDADKINKLLHTGKISSTDVGSHFATTALIKSYTDIQALADGSRTPASTDLPEKSDYTKIGIGFTSQLTAAADAAVVDLLNDLIDGLNPANVEELHQIQTLLGTVDAVIRAAMDPNGSPVSIEIFTALGLTGVSSHNLVTVRAKIAASSADLNQVSSIAALDDLIKDIKTSAIKRIEDYNNEVYTDELVKQDYWDADITVVNDDNLQLANAAILIQEEFAANSQAKIQTVVETAIATLGVIATAALANTAASFDQSTYHKIGLGQIKAENYAQINALLNSPKIKDTDVNSFAEINAMVNSYLLIRAAADGDHNDDTPPLPTLADYTNINIVFVNEGNTRVMALLSDAIGGLSVAAVDSQKKIQDLTDYVEAVMDAAANQNGSALTVELLANLGFSGVNANNLVTIAGKIASSHVSGSDVDTFNEIQDIIDAVATAALIRIENYNNGTQSTALVLQDYLDAGITEVSADNLLLANAAILIQENGAADTQTEVQTVVDNAIAALTAIKAYNQGNGSSPAPLLLQDYLDAGITGVTVTAANLDLANAAILIQQNTAVDSYTEIQTVVDTAIASLAEIIAATGDTAINVTALHFTQVGIARDIGGSQVELNALLNVITDEYVKSYTKINALVNSYLDIQLAADGDHGVSAKVPARADYTNIGINFADQSNTEVVALLSDAIGGLSTVAVDSLSEIQTLVQHTEAILQAVGSVDNGAALTLEQFTDLGFSRVNANNLITVAGKVAGSIAGGSGVDTFAEIQEMIDAVIPEALASIEAFNNSTDVTNGRLGMQVFRDIDIDTVTTDNLAAINNKVFAADIWGADSVAEVETIVQSAIAAYGLALEDLKTAAGNNDASGINAALYSNVGLTNVDNDNYGYLSPFIESFTYEDVDTYAEVQAIADAVLKIRLAADAGVASPTVLEKTDFLALHIVIANEEKGVSLLSSVINQMIDDKIDTPTEISSLAISVNNVIYAAGGGLYSDRLTHNDLTKLGLSDAHAKNFVTIKALIFATADSGSEVDTFAKMQTLIVDMQNAAINTIETYIQTDLALVVQDYWNAGAYNVTTANIDVVNSEVLAAAATEANSQDKIKAIVEVAITMVDALTTIKNHAELNTATAGNPSLADYQTARVQNITALTLAAVNSLLNSALVGAEAVDSRVKIQQLVDNYTAIYDSADGIDNGDPTLSMADYKALGLNNLDSAGRAKLLSSVLDLKSNTDVDSYDELQAIADTADRLFDSVSSNIDNLSVTDLTDLGVVGVSNNNIGQIRARLAANAADESAYDTLAALQLIVDQAFTVAVANFTGSVAGRLQFGTPNDGDSDPDLLVLADGGYVVGWMQYKAGGFDLALQRVATNGLVTGVKQEVYPDTSIHHKFLRLTTIGTAGDILACWMTEGSGQIFVQRYDENLQLQGAKTSIFNEGGPNVNIANLDILATNADGGYVIAWSEENNIYYNNIDKNGTPAGSLRVSTNISSDVQLTPIGENGSFLMCWTEQNSHTKGAISLQVVNADGTLGSKGAIGETSTIATNYSAEVIMLEATGEFVITWSNHLPPGDSDVLSQKYDANLTPVGSQLTLGIGYYSTITAIGTSGEYVVVWTNNTMIHVQKVNADDTLAAGEYPIVLNASESNVSLADTTPIVSEIGTAGDFVVVWQGKTSEGSDIYTQRISAEGELLVTWIGSGDVDITTSVNTNLVTPESYAVEFNEGQLWANGVQYASGASIAATDWVNVQLKGINAATYDVSITVNLANGETITSHPYDMTTPLILDLNNNGIETLSVDNGILFDIDADGIVDNTGWVGKNDGLLVHDLNGDGLINDAGELFGEHSLLADGTKAKDGYAALAALDSNGDGLINAADDKFSQLQVWVDANSDGITQAGELLSLQQAGVSEITLSYQHSNIDSNGNTIGMLGSYTNNSGEQQQMGDVWFKYQSGAPATGSLTATAMGNSATVNIESPVAEPDTLDVLNLTAAQAVTVKAQLLEEYASLFTEFTSLVAKAAQQNAAILTEHLGADSSTDAANTSAQGQSQATSHLFPLLEPAGDPASDISLWLTPAELEHYTLDDILEDVGELSATIDNLYANSSTELFEGLTDSQQGTPLDMATFSVSENAEDLITIPRSHNDYE
ncbi:MAG: hypothetical protein OFPI_18720 [Osedax symbiont Rs2]|nr:MAG: hypothetical protein OFPI_18720 [Osedax symbiont Rs2]